MTADLYARSFFNIVAQIYVQEVGQNHSQEVNFFKSFCLLEVSSTAKIYAPEVSSTWRPRRPAAVPLCPTPSSSIARRWPPRQPRPPRAATVCPAASSGRPPADWCESGWPADDQPARSVTIFKIKGPANETGFLVKDRNKESFGPWNVFVMFHILTLFCWDIPMRKLIRTPGSRNSPYHWWRRVGTPQIFYSWESHFYTILIF